jgi:hypothetical protein
MHATRQVRPFWRRVRELIPVRHGILAIDDSGPRNQGTASVDVQQHHCLALADIATASSLCRRIRSPASWRG